MINIRWNNFDTILSKFKGYGRKNFPREYLIFKLVSLAFWCWLLSRSKTPPFPYNRSGIPGSILL